jgi:hypothetical protein
MDDFDALIEEWSDYLGIFGTDDLVEAQRVIDNALEKGYSIEDIKDAYKEARDFFLR